MNFYRVVQSVAHRHPDLIAIRFEGRETSYAELDSQVARVASAVRALGVEPGDRVLLLAPNRPEGLALYLACAYIGAIFVPVNVAFGPTELQYVLGNAEPSLVFVDPPLVAKLGAAADEVGASPRVIELGPDGFGEGVDVEAGGASPVDLVEVAPETGVLISYTSGSTSRPKPVLLSHAAEEYAAWTHVQLWNLEPGDTGIVAMSLAWLYGLCTTSMSFLAAGATVDLLDHFNPVRVLESIEAHRGSVFVGVATMYIKLLDVLTSRDFDVSSMRVWSVGGEPVPDALHSGFERRVGRRILEAYGSSEVRPLAITNPAKDPDPPAGAAGSLVLGVELRLVDADGNDVPRGTPGEAWARGPGMMTEYFREPEITAQRRTADGWFKMGDILRQDEAGWVYVVGRTGDMIIRGGTNVSPIEIESALLEHEDVDEAIVVGVPDATYGEAIVAVVVGRSGREIDPEILRAHAAGSVAAYKVPQAFWVTDDLPRNPNGKLDRSAVKRRAADEVAGGGELSDRVAGPFV